MSIVVRFSPDSMTSAQYDEVLRRCQETLDWPPRGLEYHVCFGTDGDLRVSEIWDSRQDFEAFGEHLMPLLEESGIRFSGPPEIFEIHNAEHRALQSH